jgi:DNA-binding CsgD family transcriptional regulator
VHSTPNDAAGREYAAGPYLLDPYYEAFRKSRHGCFRFRDLAPDRTRLSEDFLAHYRRYDIGDEIGLILAMDQGRGGHVSLTRRRGRPMFARADCQWLSATAPLVETAMRQRDAGISNEPKARDIRLHDGLNRALNNFGRSVLTEREVDVVRWLLRGYPAKAIARQLAISPETVRNHLKNIYPKLKIGSHAELFALFFRAIQAGSGSHDSDPLADLP